MHGRALFFCVSIAVVLGSGCSSNTAGNTRTDAHARESAVAPPNPSASSKVVGTFSSASAPSFGAPPVKEELDVKVVGTFRGNDPFAPPPSGPAPAYEPPPVRPPGTDPEDPAQAIKQCAAVKSCGACNNWGYCGYCAANRTCVPKDKHGAYPGTCPGGYTPNSCSMAFYFEEHEPETRRRLVEYMAELKPEGMPIDRQATMAATLHIPVTRGKCYGATFRVSYDADGYLNPDAKVSAKYIGIGGNWAPIYTDTYAMTPFCPQESGHIVVSTKPEKTTKGTFRVQLFSAPIADATLRKQMDEYETRTRQLMVQSACAHCARNQALCLLDGAPRCLANYLVCLGEVHLTPEDCERGDVLPKPPEKTPPQAWLQLLSHEGGVEVAECRGSAL